MLFFIPSSFVLSFIGALFIGYHDQLTMMNSVRVLKAFNPGEKGTSQVAIAMTGYAVGPFVWTFLIAKFVNPRNVHRSVIYVERGEDISYFDNNIVKQYNNYLILQLGIYLLLIVPLLLMMPNPPGCEGSIWKKDDEDKKTDFATSILKTRDSIREVLNESARATRTFRKTENLKASVLSVNLLDKKVQQPIELKTVCKDSVTFANIRDTEAEVSDKVSTEGLPKELFTRDFGVIVILGVIRTSTSRFLLGNYKLIGLHFFHDDILISLIGSITYIAYMVQGLTYGWSISKLGLIGGYKLIFWGFIISHLLFSLIPDSLLVFTMLTIIHRVRSVVFAGVYKNDRPRHNV